ncbi:MAG: C25 family cysteine peptidase [Bacteroidetes bacterium]|nr:C25 family cysteine peptidase [Bacteroidota bacterium]
MTRSLFLLTTFLSITLSLNAENFSFSNSWSRQGFNLTMTKADMVQVVYSIHNFSIEPVIIEGQPVKKVNLPGVFLSNDAGKPDLPGTGRYIAIPQGSTPHLNILDFEVETFQGIDLAWAPQTPLDTQKDIVYRKDQVTYATNAFYPANPVQISRVEQIRGTDVIILGITPFQYNPVTKELKVYKNIRINLTFEGGSHAYGNDAFRSPYWDPIMADNILNFSSLPSVNYPEKMQQIRTSKSAASNECEYIIISPDGPDFLRWADTLKNWRNQQGILTKVFSLTQVGGNTETAIKAFISDAYANWTIKPVACLLLGDYGTDASKNIISHLYFHPYGYPDYASDNYYADVTGDDLPDVVFSRICANDSAELRIMVGRIMNFERNRPSDTGYYMHPISALGWEDDRWFQLCSELVGGFWKNKLGKHVQRINALYTPANNYNTGPWSTAPNTSTVISYFGPSGLNYIPDNPGDLGGFTDGTATKINNAINEGAFVLLHRDHGNYTRWGEPSYSDSSINELTNTLLPFVFSINCETGAFHNPQGCPSQCFSEVFQGLTKNGHDAGALGLICPTETSLSFVNDTYLWGVFDNLWPQFMPDYGTPPVSRGMLPAFGNAGGKYFLQQSGWPYNSDDKQITFRLFHMHGDAFLQLADEVPMELTVNHPATVDVGATTVEIIANDSSFIALTMNNEIITTALGSASGPVTLTIPALPVGTKIMVVATKQDFKRHTSFITVAQQILAADFITNNTSVCTGSPVDFTDFSTGSPSGWEWTFQGATPGTSNLKNPSSIIYSAPGDYDVSLTVSKAGMNPSTKIKPAYIHVDVKPVAAFANDASCEGSATSFTDLSTYPGTIITSWSWNFGDPSSGSSNTSNLQNPVHTYLAAGTYPVTLNIQSTNGCSDTKNTEVVIVAVPASAVKPSGPDSVNTNRVSSTEFTTLAAANATGYDWIIDPSDAGTITGALTGTATWANKYKGNVKISVKARNDCGDAPASMEKTVVLYASAGIGEINGPGFEVYPNPASGKFTIEFNSHSAVPVEINVFNSLGSTVFSEKDLLVSGKFSKLIDLTGNPDGIYYIRIQSEAGSFIRKLVIEK